MTEIPLPSPTADHEVQTETRPLSWSVRREIWENRFLYLGPLIVTAFVLLGSFIRAVRLASRDILPLQPFRMAPAPIMLATFVIGFFYALDALYGERRDRSILFWKSLPVSDRTTVLSKIAIPLAVLPLFAFTLSVATQLLLLIPATAVLLANGLSLPTFFGELQFVQGLIVMLYGLTVHALWFAPIYGWLILVSAWARRAPFLWAVLPLLVMLAVERIALGTSAVASMLRYRLTGAMTSAFTTRAGGAQHESIDRISQLDPLKFLSTPGLWIGLLAAALFLAAAVRLRRNREPI